MQSMNKFKLCQAFVVLCSLFVIQICCVSVWEGLDYPISNINYGGNGAQWDGDTEYFYYGNDSARSGVCENDASSWFVSEISRKTYISFYWKVSSEKGYDFLRFYIDDVLRGEISGDVDWTKMSYNIELENSTSLKWEYSKDGSGSSGMDCGWVDKLVIEDQSVPSITLNEALDNDNLDFTTGDIYTWYGQEEDSYYGGSAVSSSLCKYNSEDSQMSTTFEGYGKFSFYWRAICDNGMCQTAFNVDGTSKNIIFGQQESWEQVIYYNLKEGVREILWGYGLMMNSDHYDNYCVLDKVQFEQYKDISLNEALDNQDAVLSTEGDNNWYGQDEISMDGNSAARSGNIKESQTSEMHALVNAFVLYYYLRRTAPFYTKGHLMKAISKFPKQQLREGCEKVQPTHYLTDREIELISKAFESGPDFQYFSLNNLKNICAPLTKFSIRFILKTGLKYGNAFELRDEANGDLLGSILVYQPGYYVSLFQYLVGFELKIPIFWSRKSRKEGWGSIVSSKFNQMSNEVMKVHKKLLNNRKHWVVDLLAVVQSAQGKGVGTKLLDSVKALAFEGGHPIYLECHDNNVGFYEKQGFKRIHTENIKPKHKDIKEGLNINFMLYEFNHKIKND
ncbi:gnat family acetyltransferase [Anaeramoeba flamelloides]|uniref:Gnat family acetyltransferase n=1 Tax=Anaeramoeba flamelloides TaxID=1746091 RepID=A0ABQ8YZR6_9EUKA|nr:gnat family acetyltransferase [Anaeramoeba flamelloides]